MIVHCYSQYPYLKDWKDLLASLNFECESVTELETVKGTLESEFGFPYQLLSFAFTTIGKIKCSISQTLRREKKIYFNKI